MFRDRGKDWKHIPLDEFFYEQFFSFNQNFIYRAVSFIEENIKILKRYA